MFDTRAAAVYSETNSRVFFFNKNTVTRTSLELLPLLSEAPHFCLGNLTTR